MGVLIYLLNLSMILTTSLSLTIPMFTSCNYRVRLPGRRKQRTNGASYIRIEVKQTARQLRIEVKQTARQRCLGITRRCIQFS